MFRIQVAALTRNSNSLPTEVERRGGRREGTWALDRVFSCSRVRKGVWINVPLPLALSLFPSKIYSSVRNYFASFPRRHLIFSATFTSNLSKTWLSKWAMTLPAKKRVLFSLPSLNLVNTFSSPEGSAHSIHYCFLLAYVLPNWIISNGCRYSNIDCRLGLPSNTKE